MGLRTGCVKQGIEVTWSRCRGGSRGTLYLPLTRGYESLTSYESANTDETFYFRPGAAAAGYGRCTTHTHTYTYTHYNLNTGHGDMGTTYLYHPLDGPSGSYQFFAIRSLPTLDPGYE